MADIDLAVQRRRSRSLAREASSSIIRSVVSWVVTFVVVANAAIIVWLWLKGGGISSVHGWGDFFTSSGRITGLLGGYLLLIQVLLLARLPFIERSIGFDRLTVWHRLNGKVCLGLVLAHTGLITLGYASMDRLSITKEINALLTQYPGMVSATVGTALMVLVVVTSLVIVRRRLRYEAWYAVHLMAYLAIGLAWIHQIPTGNEFAVSPTSAAYWTGLYLATCALLVLFRLAQPMLMNWRHGLRVAEVVEEGPGVVSIRMTGRNLDRMNARAGQFFLWRFLSRGRWWESHPFSLSEAPNGSSLRITVKNSGDFTSQIASIKPGTRVLAEGPFGVFTGDARRREHVLLIAGGIGITPMRGLVEEMPHDTVLIYRTVRQEGLIFQEELRRLAAERGIRLYNVVGDHATEEGRNLLSADHLRQLVPDIADRDVYICGPTAMMEVLERNVRRVDVPKKHIHTERFAL